MLNSGEEYFLEILQRLIGGEKSLSNDCINAKCIVILLPTATDRQYVWKISSSTLN